MRYDAHKKHPVAQKEVVRLWALRLDRPYQTPNSFGITYCVVFGD
jgi:hypothetical protein